MSRINKLLAEIRPNALWDVIKYGGAFVIASVSALAYWVYTQLSGAPFSVWVMVGIFVLSFFVVVVALLLIGSKKVLQWYETAENELTPSAVMALSSADRTANDYKIEQLKTFVREYHEIHPMTYMPMTTEYAWRSRAFDDKVTRFLGRYFGDWHVAAFKANRPETLEGLLAELHGVKTDALVPEKSQSTGLSPNIEYIPKVFSLGRVILGSKGLRTRPPGQAHYGAVLATFGNMPKPGQRVTDLENVRAQIVFYSSKNPAGEFARVDDGCWLDGDSPLGDFPLNKSRQLVVGVWSYHGSDRNKLRLCGYFEGVKKPKLMEPFNPSFTDFRVRVTLIPDGYSELSQQFLFDLKFGNGVIKLTDVSDQLRTV